MAYVGEVEMSAPLDAAPALERIAPREAPSIEISRRLLDYLVSGQIRPGDRLPSERQLASQLGVGRSAVRDALRPLLLLGVVEARQGDGTYRRQSESTLLPEAIEWGLLLGDHTTVDLIEARAYLEVAHAELAAERRTDADLSRMETHLQEMEDAGDDVAAFNDADVAFHLAVAAASGNTVLYGTLASIRSLLRAWINRVIRASAGTRPSYEEHVPVYEAIRAGDASAAAEAMRAHMNAARQRLMATVDPTNDGVPIGPKE